MSKKKTPSKQQVPGDGQEGRKEMVSLLTLTMELQESTDMPEGVASVRLPHELL